MNPVMHDMGEERDNGLTVANEESKKEIYYPRTTVNSKNIPEIEEYDVGDECEKHIVARVVGKNIDENEDGKNVRVELEILKMGVMPYGDSKKRDEMGISKENMNKLKDAGMY